MATPNQNILRTHLELPLHILNVRQLAYLLLQGCGLPNTKKHIDRLLRKLAKRHALLHKDNTHQPHDARYRCLTSYR